MFMRFLENKKLIAAVLVIWLFITTGLAQKSPKTGYWLGSIGLFDKSEGFIPSPNLQVYLVSKGKKKITTSDENGDFQFIELPVGRYCVASIQDSFGNSFQIDSNQGKCFEIKKKRTTRFDIAVIKN